jgi:hypothetical protein
MWAMAGAQLVPPAVAAQRQDILRVAARHGATNVRLFGSAARGEAGAGSDLDLLVTMTPGRTLLDLVALAENLEALLGCRVDVVSDRGLSPYLRDRILAEATGL